MGYLIKGHCMKLPSIARKRKGRIFPLTIKCLLFIMCISKQHIKERRAELFEDTYIKFLGQPPVSTD